MAGEKSVDEIAEEWTAIRAIRNDHLAEGIREIALDIARGKYTDCRIIPAELLVDTDTLLREHDSLDPSHVLFAKESEAAKADRIQRHGIYMVFLDTAAGTHRQVEDKNQFPYTSTKYGSFEEQLKAEGFRVESAFKYEHLADGLDRLSLDIVRGRYSKVRIVPGDVAMQGSGWTPEEPAHFVYAQLSEACAKERNEKQILHVVQVLCKGAGGEVQFIQL